MRLIAASHRPLPESWFLLAENRVEIAERRVRQAEGHIHGQYQIIEHLAALGLSTAKAEGFLGEFKSTLAAHRRDLGDVLGQRTAGFRDERDNLVV